MKIQKEAIAAVAILTLAGCTSSDSASGTTTTTTTTPTTDAKVVTDNPTKTYPWTSLVGKTNVSAFIRGAESGSTVSQRPIKIVSAYSQAGEDIFTILANGTDVYGPGDSGSPVLLSDGSVVGALFAGDDPQHLYGISITQMQTIGQTGTVKKPAASGLPANSWAPRQWFFVGPSSVLPLVTKRAQFAQAHYVGASPASGSARPVAPAKPSLIAGTRYASALLYGPDGQIYVSGTYTFELPNGKWVATGHAIEGQGPALWPIYPDYVDFIENDGTVESHISGSAFGTLSFDGPFGSLIDTTKVPTLLPVTETITLDGKANPTVTHDTVLDRGSAYEAEGVDIGSVLPLAELISTSDKMFTGGATITVYQGGQPTQSFFPDNGLGTISTEGPENATTFYTDIETAVDTAWATAYFTDPTTQVEKIVVQITATTSPFNPKTKGERRKARAR